MIFVNTHRLSPVANGVDLPWDNDLFHFSVEEIPEIKKTYTAFLQENNIVIDQSWWYEQDRRCRDGYVIENAIAKGGDAIIDGRDCIWNDGDTDMYYHNDNFGGLDVIIKPNSCYLVDIDLHIHNKTLRITGRHYFYLNFWKISKKKEGEIAKGYYNPDFTDIDFLFSYRVELMFKFAKDSSELKARQLGFSQKTSGMIAGYNFTFIKSSQNIEAAASKEDRDNIFTMTIDGLEQLYNTQFYKERSKTDKVNCIAIAKRFRSQVRGVIVTDKQSLSRFSPFWVIYEEVGKWPKGLLLEVVEFVKPSILTGRIKTGYQTFIGTGGDMEAGADDLEKIHYKKKWEEGYLKFVNKFERQETRSISGWFSSKAWFTVRDKDGNSLWDEGIKYVEEEIRLKDTAKERYNTMTQWALYASDAFMISSAGYFGEYKTTLLNAQLIKIRLNKSLQEERHGILTWNDIKDHSKGVKFVDTSEEDAWITICEEPLLDDKNEQYKGLYIGGTDSYDMDESKTSSSKGSLVIRKKFLHSNTTFDKDVALIFNRPGKQYGGAEMFFERTIMACIYYGMALNYIEHSNLLIFTYYQSNGYTHLLGTKPQLAFANKIFNPKGMNDYGVGKDMKPHSLAILNSDVDESFIENMRMTEQIKAFINFKYHKDYNCDITMASAMAAVGNKENINSVAYTDSQLKEKVDRHVVYVKKNGILVQQYS